MDNLNWRGYEPAGLPLGELCPRLSIYSETGAGAQRAAKLDVVKREPSSDNAVDESIRRPKLENAKL